MTDALTLPAGFEGLAAHAAVWGHLETQEERYLQRQHSAMKDLKAFYDATAPRLEEVFTHLDRFDPMALPEAEALLFRVVLGLTEASQAVEIFGQPRVPYAPFPHSVNMEWVGYDAH